MGENGQQQIKPTVALFWNPQTQGVEVKVDPEQVRSWEFAKMLCLEGSEVCVKAAKMAMLRAAQEQEANQRLANQLVLPK